MARCLLVEPQDDLRLIIAGQLRGCRHAVVDVAEPADAERQLTSGRFDLVVVALHLGRPDLDDLARSLKARLTPRRVIVIAPGGWAAVDARAKHWTVDAVLTRPLSMETLCAVVSMVCPVE